MNSHDPTAEPLANDDLAQARKRLTPPIKFGTSFVFSRLSHLIASGFGSGLSPVAPGTMGTLWAWLIFLLIDPFLTDLLWTGLLVVGFLIGIWACERTCKDLGVEDHGGVVWDEVIAFWLVLWVLPATWGWQLAGFIAFRFFDAVKPPPVGWADRNFSGGFGVMFDDILAAFMALLVLAVLFAPWFSRIF